MVDEPSDKRSDGKQVVYVPLYPGMPGANIHEDEIDLLELWNALWRRKLFIGGFTLLATLIAVYVSLFVLPVTYQSTAVLLPNQQASSKLGSLGSLASALPIPLSLPGTVDDSLLMDFLESRNLKLRLIGKYDLLPRLYKNDWDPVKKTWRIKDKKDIPTPIMAIQQEKLDKIYQVSQDKKTQLITISFIDEDQAFTRTVLKGVIEELKNYLANDYVSDAKRERIFVEKQLAGATRELERWEQQVPTKEISLAKIKREVMAGNTVYAEMRKQVELAKFAEAKEVVDFKVLDPPFVPEKKYRPKRALICALTLVSAGFIAIFIALIRQGLDNRARTAADRRDEDVAPGMDGHDGA